MCSAYLQRARNGGPLMLEKIIVAVAVKLLWKLAERIEAGFCAKEREATRRGRLSPDRYEYQMMHRRERSSEELGLDDKRVDAAYEAWRRGKATPQPYRSEYRVRRRVRKN